MDFAQVELRGTWIIETMLRCIVEPLVAACKVKGEREQNNLINL